MLKLVIFELDQMKPISVKEVGFFVFAPSFCPRQLALVIAGSMI